MVAAKKIYRKEDIEKMGSQAVNAGFGLGGADTYSIWLYKGGANCHHYWLRKTYISKDSVKPDINSPKTTPAYAQERQKEGIKADLNNHLLMHAMGPNVAGVIGSAVAAGVLLTLVGV